MNAVTEIALENIRCFAEKQTVSLPRIAILVGENSTGKSTFLACCSALAELSCYEKIDPYDPFNVAPFNMGTFETIARHGSNSFTLAGRVGEVDLSFQFVNEHSKPSEHTATIQAGKVPELKLEQMPSEDIWHLTGPSYDFNLNTNEISQRQFSQWLAIAIRQGVLPYGRDVKALEQRATPPQDPKKIPLLINHLAQISENLLPSKPVLHAVPPHIDIPSRLYGEVPLAANMDEFKQIKDRLREAGKKLGLFSKINIASMPDGPYALEVTIDNHTHSIADAGFGVHSVLSYLKIIVENSDSTVLMQQPETHLHPMAQAWLSQLITESKGRHIIETHADHIINRISICIRKGEINYEEAAIFWFEKNEDGVTIHRIDFDEAGNLIDAPSNYRAFFIREQKDFLGFE